MGKSMVSGYDFPLNQSIESRKMDGWMDECSMGFCWEKIDEFMMILWDLTPGISMVMKAG